MSYLNWFKTHSQKHQEIVKRVANDELVSYFRWENISKSDVDFCPLFVQNKKCHDELDLNCYLCACPNFRFDDDAFKIKSWCSINSKDGKVIESMGTTHQDCSGCNIPHKESYIKEHFDKDWLKIMRDCPSF